MEVIFNFSAEIGVFGHTFSVTLLSRCNIKTMLLQREIVPSQTSDMGKKTVSVLAHSFLLP